MGQEGLQLALSHVPRQGQRAKSGNYAVSDAVVADIVHDQEDEPCEKPGEKNCVSDRHSATDIPVAHRAREADAPSCSLQLQVLAALQIKLSRYAITFVNI
jgi:hypothetical protein